MSEYLGAIDLKTVAELDVGVLDDLLQLVFAFDQWQFSQVLAVQVEQIKRDEHDLHRLAFQFVLQD